MIHTLTYPPQHPRSDMGGYRYFFNGQEADNEALGDGVSLSAEFWQYDSRLGRRWNVDPVFKEYESPYACFAGNPLWYVDPSGDTVIAYNNDRVTKKYMKRYFKEHFGSSKMFRFANNGMLLVDDKRYDRFFAESNTRQQILLSGIKEAIEVQERVLVIIQKTSPTIVFSRMPVTGYTNDGTPEFGEIIRSIIHTGNTGGGGTGYDKRFGAYLLGICNQEAGATRCSTGISIAGIFENKSFDLTTGNASSAFLHELLDEFLNFYVKHSITKESPPIDQVQYQNAALENLKSLKRDGEDHER